MLELTALALRNRVANIGLQPIVTTRLLAADPSTIRALITDEAGLRLMVDALP